MQEKIAIRKKALVNRKKKYFKISPQFFNPLINHLKKKKIKVDILFHYTIQRIMKWMS